jgi:small subunit ribosomal protein S16
VAVKIRLMRVGKKKQPTYRVVVADARSPRDGRFIEILGQYEPRQDPSRVAVDTERALHWLRRGAQPTEQVAKILEFAGVWDAYKTEAGRDAAARPKPRTPKRTPDAPPAAATSPETGSPQTSSPETSSPETSSE